MAKAAKEGATSHDAPRVSSSEVTIIEPSTIILPGEEGFEPTKPDQEAMAKRVASIPDDQLGDAFRKACLSLYQTGSTFKANVLETTALAVRIYLVNGTIDPANKLIATLRAAGHDSLATKVRNYLVDSGPFDWTQVERTNEKGKIVSKFELRPNKSKRAALVRLQAKGTEVVTAKLMSKTLDDRQKKGYQGIDDVAVITNAYRRLAKVANNPTLASDPRTQLSDLWEDFKSFCIKHGITTNVVDVADEAA